MNDNSSDTLMIVDMQPYGPTTPGGRPLSPRGRVGEMILRTTEYSVSELQNNMTEFLNGVQTLLAKCADAAGDFQINTVEIDAQITGEGKIGFAGTGLNLTGSTGMKIVLKRKIDVPKDKP